MVPTSSMSASAVPAEADTSRPGSPRSRSGRLRSPRRRDGGSRRTGPGGCAAAAGSRAGSAQTSRRRAGRLRSRPVRDLAEQTLGKEGQAGLDAPHGGPRLAIELLAQPGHPLPQETRLRGRWQRERRLDRELQVGRHGHHPHIDLFREKPATIACRRGSVETAYPAEKGPDSGERIGRMETMAAAKLHQLGDHFVEQRSIEAIRESHEHLKEMWHGYDVHPVRPQH